MGKGYRDKRLPRDISIWENDFEEFVAVKNGMVAEYKDEGISASRTLEGAIQNYLNKETKTKATY